MKQRQGRTVILMCAVFCIITSACTEKSRGSDSLGTTEEINYEATILEVQEDFGTTPDYPIKEGGDALQGCLELIGDNGKN